MKKLFAIMAVFLLLFICFSGCVETSKLYEYYNTGDNASYPIYDDQWIGQTFTIGTIGADVEYILDYVRLKLFKKGDVDILYVSIMTTDGDGKPTGNKISNGTIDATAITTNSNAEWYPINMDPVFLQPSTKYAIVCTQIGGDSLNSVSWKLEQFFPTYGGGSIAVTIDAGSSWSLFTYMDMMFEVWGRPVIEYPYGVMHD